MMDDILLGIVWKTCPKTQPSIRVALPISHHCTYSSIRGLGSTILQVNLSSMKRKRAPSPTLPLNDDPSVPPMTSSQPPAKRRRLSPISSSESPSSLPGLLSVSPPPRVLNHDIYAYHGGLRIALATFFEFRATVKKRWWGRTVMDIYTTEFVGFPEEYYLEECRLGRICVNGEAVGPAYVLKEHEILTHTPHRHELPVTNTSFDFLTIDSTYLILNKPSSIPVHPCGKYCANSITKILQNEYGIPISSLFPLHRLDKLTSGVLLFARSREIARAFSHHSRSHHITKVYVARAHGMMSALGQVIPVRERMRSVNRRKGLWGIVGRDTPNYVGVGVESLSFVMPLMYDEESNSTVVLVELHTGRTHQVRIHLRFLGHPIPNDPIYGPDEFARIQQNGDIEPMVPVEGFVPPDGSVDSDCWECRQMTVLTRPAQMLIFLHSWKYRSEELGLDVTAPLPSWVRVETGTLEQSLGQMREQIEALVREELGPDEEREEEQ